MSKPSKLGRRLKRISQQIETATRTIEGAKERYELRTESAKRILKAAHKSLAAIADWENAE